MILFKLSLWGCDETWFLNILNLGNGKWSDDVGFSACSEDCGGGKKTKFKYCNNPTPEHGGANCTCNAMDTTETSCDGLKATIEESCNEHKCPRKYINYLFRLHFSVSIF